MKKHSGFCEQSRKDSSVACTCGAVEQPAQAPAQQNGPMFDVAQLPAPVPMNAFEDLLFSRNKWHMLCDHFKLDPAKSCVATVSDRLERAEAALAEIVKAAEQHFDIEKPYLHWRNLCDALKKGKELL